MSTKRLFSFQPSEFTDHVTADGTELTKLPYPVHAWEDSRVPSDLGGWSEPKRIIGFQRDLAVQQVDLFWRDYRVGDPQAAVGMYVVAEMPDGNVTGLTTAVRDVQVRTVDVADTIDPLSVAPDGQRRREGWT